MPVIVSDRITKMKNGDLTDDFIEVSIKTPNAKWTRERFTIDVLAIPTLIKELQKYVKER